MNDNYKFFMVFVEGGNAPSVKHWSRSDAKKEAARLAVKTGKTTYVLESSFGMKVPTPLPVIFDTSEVAPAAVPDPAGDAV